MLLFCISFGQNANDISKQIQSVKYSISELNKNYQIQTDEYKKSLNELEKELEELRINLTSNEEKNSDGKYSFKLRYNAQLFEKPTKSVLSISKGVSLEFIKPYDNHWWQVHNGNTTGYLYFTHVIDTSTVTKFLKDSISSFFEEIERSKKENQKRLEEEFRLAKQKRLKEEFRLEAEKIRITEELIKKGTPLIISDVGVEDINSANGVDFFVKWRYLDPKKIIKYIYFTATPYNAVGDIQKCSIRGSSVSRVQVTGPIESGGVSTSVWEATWYNNTIRCIKLTKVKIIYTDGTQYTYVNELPKLFDSGFKNSCKYK